MELCSRKQGSIERNFLGHFPYAHEEDIESVYFFGEWCGPNVQKGVAVSHIPNKIFVLFGIRIKYCDGRVRNVPIEYLEECLLFDDDLIYDNSINFYNIFQFGKYEVEIDFSNPEAVQNELVRLTEEVEANCPVGKFFGVTKNTVGEGIVWVSEEDYSGHVFKVKSEKHVNGEFRLSGINLPYELEKRIVNKLVSYGCTNFNYRFSE